MRAEFVLWHDFHRTIEQQRKCFGQRQALREQIVSARKLDEEIDIALMVLLTAGDGTEYADTFGSELVAERFYRLTFGVQLFEQHAL